MQILQRISHVFRNIRAIGNRHGLSAARMLSRESTDDLARQLYGMDMHEQSKVRQVLTMPGETVLVRQNTFATNKNNDPCYIEKDLQVRLSEDPLTFDKNGELRINILVECDRSLSMRLSDYIEDIDARRQGPEPAGNV